MLPLINDGEILRVQPANPDRLKVGQIVLFRQGSDFKAHRIIRKQRDQIITRGDASSEPDGAIRGGQIVGKIVAKECQESGQIVLLDGVRARLSFFARKARGRVAQTLRRGIRSCFLFALLLLAISLVANAQVALDTTTSIAQRATSGANTITLAHTSTGSNLVLVVGVSMNISAQTATTVSGVTYNGVALIRAGFHNDSTNVRRVEMWYLAGPATGLHNVVVAESIAGAGNIGAVVGATTFTGADQTTPIRAFASNDSNGTNDAANVTVSSGANDMVLDTLAIDGNHTVSAPGGTQVQQWAIASSGTGGFASDVYGYGSTHGGAAHRGEGIEPAGHQLGARWVLGCHRPADTIGTVRHTCYASM
jgi:hypothetical protein